MEAITTPHTEQFALSLALAVVPAKRDAEEASTITGALEVVVGAAGA